MTTIPSRRLRAGGFVCGVSGKEVNAVKPRQQGYAFYDPIG